MVDAADAAAVAGLVESALGVVEEGPPGEVGEPGCRGEAELDPDQPAAEVGLPPSETVGPDRVAAAPSEVADQVGVVPP